MHESESQRVIKEAEEIAIQRQFILDFINRRIHKILWESYKDEYQSWIENATEIRPEIFDTVQICHRLLERSHQEDN